MKQNHTKHAYFSFFDPLKVTGELEMESLGRVHGGELAMGRNRYHSFLTVTDNLDFGQKSVQNITIRKQLQYRKYNIKLLNSAKAITEFLFWSEN